jgi:hypothetical protein
MAISGVGGVSGLAGTLLARGSATQLSPEQQQEVNRLKAIDRKVRAHEQAHMAAGAGLTGAANYQFTRGPDGRQYAVGGEVTINLSRGQTPESTIERAVRIQAAALAPADPSAQDRSVAAAAAMMESQARAELSAMKREAAAPGGAASAAQQASALRAYAGQDAQPERPRIDQYA